MTAEPLTFDTPLCPEPPAAPRDRADTDPRPFPGPRAEVAPRPRSEPRSPFLGAEPARAPSLDALVDEDQRDRPLVLELVCDVPAVVRRLAAPGELEGLVKAGLLLTVASAGVHAAGLMSPYGPLVAARAAGLTAASLLFGLAAALGPIYGTGVLVAARLPMARLVAVLLAATAAGALGLAGLTPLVRLALAWDPVWVGPLAQVGGFLVMGALTGLRLSRLLVALAEASAPGPLTEGARFRVGILSRMALSFSALTTCLALWAFDAFLVG